MARIFSLIGKINLYDLTEIPDIIHILECWRMCKRLEDKPEKEDSYNIMRRHFTKILKSNNLNEDNVLEFIANNLDDILEACKKEITNCELISKNLQNCGECSSISINLQTCEDCKRIMNLDTIKTVITRYKP